MPTYAWEGHMTLEEARAYAYERAHEYKNHTQLYAYWIGVAHGIATQINPIAHGYVKVEKLTAPHYLETRQ